ncbi:MAG: hypothetical protein WAJ85_01945 [Candidatus Baltobacteraceae bacterium]
MKFYFGFFIFLALVIGLSFYGGYRVGLQHAAAHGAHGLVPVAVPTTPP